MAKRFVDTSLYDKPWFRKLPIKIKCLWEYLRLKCDIAGVIDLDIELASFQIGETITWDDLDHLKDQIIIIDETKVVLIDFIKFQYGQLSESCKPHKSVIELVNKYNLKERVNEPFVKGIQRDKEKDKYKDQEKYKEKEKEKEKEKIETLVTQHDIITLWDKHVSGVGAVRKFPAYFLPQKTLDNFLITSGFPEFRNLEQWENYFKKISSCEPVANGEWCVDLSWAVIHDNAIKVLSGKYEKSFVRKKQSEDIVEAAIQNIKNNPFRNCEE